MKSIGQSTSNDVSEETEQKLCLSEIGLNLTELMQIFQT